MGTARGQRRPVAEAARGLGLLVALALVVVAAAAVIATVMTLLLT